MSDLDAGLAAPTKDQKPVSLRRLEAMGSAAILTAHLGVQPVRDTSPALVRDATEPDYLIMVKHNLTFYMVVFQDGTYQRIVSIWRRNLGMKWDCVWSYLMKGRTPLTQRIKNVSAKALIEGEKARLSKEAGRSGVK